MKVGPKINAYSVSLLLGLEVIVASYYMYVE